MRKSEASPSGPPVAMSPAAFSEAVVVLKAMGSAPRAKLLALLAAEPLPPRNHGARTEGERSVGEIEQLMGVAQSAASQHLAKLRAAGIVKTRREGNMVYYSLADERVREILRLLAY